MPAPTPSAAGLVCVLARVRDLPGLPARTVAPAVDAAPSTVRAWLAGTRSPNPQHADRIVELASLVDRLASRVERDYLAVWLLTPLPALDHRCPVDAVAAGDDPRLSRLLASLESPAAESPATRRARQGRGWRMGGSSHSPSTAAAEPGAGAISQLRARRVAGRWLRHTPAGGEPL